jgi:hypothetical protein
MARVDDGFAHEAHLIFKNRHPIANVSAGIEYGSSRLGFLEIVNQDPSPLCGLLKERLPSLRQGLSTPDGRNLSDSWMTLRLIQAGCDQKKMQELLARKFGEVH